MCRSTVKLMIRKVQFAPETEGAAPSVETTREFVMSDKPLHVKASLDKEVRGHIVKIRITKLGLIPVFKHLPQNTQMLLTCVMC